MLTNEQIEANKVEFIELLNSINRSGMYKDQLIDMLTESDFFTAPASTKYHCSFDGGLCLHSLNVYKNLVELVKNREGLTPSCYDEDSLKIVALFHDISKIGCYKKGIKNEKVYFEGGTKKDELGNFEWISKLMWVTKEDRFIYGSHEATSEYITRQYIPLTLEESVAITHHMGSMAWDSAKDNIGEVYNKYSLALMLYIADMVSSYVTEKAQNE